MIVPVFNVNSSIILSKLIQEEALLSSKDLQDECNLSRKSISMLVLSINRNLQPYGAYIKTVKGKGYSIEVRDREKYNRFNIDFLFGDLRRQYMHVDKNIHAYQLLFELIFREDYTTISELESILYYSSRLISSSLKKVKSYLSFFGASITSRPHYGIKIECGEWNRRLCLIFLEEIAAFTTFVPMQKQNNSLLERFREDHLIWPVLLDVIRENFKRNKIIMSATKIAKIGQYIILARKREAYYNLLQFDSKHIERAKQTQYFGIACDLVESIGCMLKENDLVAVSILINCWIERRSIYELTKRQYEKGLRDVRRFIKYISSLYENIEQYFDSIFINEFICYLAGLQERIFFSVPAEEEVSFHMKKQGYVFSEFCLDFAIWFEKVYGIKLTEAESLSLYNIFSASFCRFNVVSRIQYKAVLVSLYGFPYARNAAFCIMKKHIEDFSNIVPMELTEIYHEDIKEYDLVITDIGGNHDDFFSTLPVPVIKQNLTNNDCSAILNNFLKESFSCKIERIFPNENYIKNTAFKNKEDVYKYLAQNYVALKRREEFLEDCRCKDSYISSSYGKQIALISTSEDFFEKKEIVILHNRWAFYWNDEKVNFILFLNRKNLSCEDSKLFNMIIFYIFKLPLHILRDSKKYSRDDLVSFIIQEIYP